VVALLRSLASLSWLYLVALFLLIAGGLAFGLYLVLPSGAGASRRLMGRRSPRVKAGFTPMISGATSTASTRPWLSAVSQI
jgi:hypothetical protein